MLVHNHPVEPLLDCLQESGGMLSLDVGQTYYLKSFGEHYVGRVKEVRSTEVVLEQAAWVADSGRLHQFLRDGRAANMEVEYVGDWVIPLAYVSGYVEWPAKFKFPLETT